MNVSIILTTIAIVIAFASLLVWVAVIWDMAEQEEKKAKQADLKRKTIEGYTGWHSRRRREDGSVLYTILVILATVLFFWAVYDTYTGKDEACWANPMHSRHGLKCIPP